MNFQYSPTFSDKRVITYGTFDLLHYGHINLLRRAKELGNYLVVGLASDAFNRDEKGKASYFSYHERRALLQAIRYVDLVIEETSWQQKISDIQLYKIDIFVIGDDWRGKFDALAEYCEVVYLPRTPEISTSKIKNDIAQPPKSAAGGGAELEFLSFLCRTTSIVKASIRKNGQTNIWNLCIILGNLPVDCFGYCLAMTKRGYLSVLIVIASETKWSAAITNQRIPNHNIEILHVSLPRLLKKSRNDRKITQLMPYRHCEHSEAINKNRILDNVGVLHGRLPRHSLTLIPRNDIRNTQVGSFCQSERNKVQHGNLSCQTPTSYSILCLLIATLALLARNDTKSLQTYIILVLQLSSLRAQQIWGALIVACFGYRLATTITHNAFKGAA